MEFFNSEEKLLNAIKNKNIENIKSILINSNINKKILDLNKKNIDNDYPLISAIDINNAEIVKLLMEYANEHHVILKLNEKNGNRDYPLLRAIYSGNNKIIKLLFEYANQHQIILEMNERNNNHEYPIYMAIDKNDFEMVELLINYASQHQVILNLNEKYIFTLYPLTTAIVNNNNEIIKLLIEYANKHQFILKYDKTFVKCLPKFVFESKKLIKNYEKEKKKEKYEKERMERERLEKKKIEREKLERERLEKERIERENVVREKLEREGIQTPTLVIAINNFSGERHDHLDFRKDEFLIVTNWYCEEDGWVYGHRKDNESEKGIFPEIFIKIYKDDNKEKINSISEITPEYKLRFENKINQLYSLNEMELIDGFTYVSIKRSNLFDDAFNSIKNKSPQELRKMLIINFEGEEGIDAGGLLRDFFYQISKEFGNLEYSLFKYSHDDSYELEINPESSVLDPNHIEHYKFIGRFIGLAVINRQNLSVSFSLLLIKRLLNKSIEFSDLEYVDKQLFKNLKELRDKDGAENLYLTFSTVFEDCYGNRQIIELKPNGANIDVTDSNKMEYIDLRIKNEFNNAKDKENLEALKKGFYEIIPKNINTLLDEIDLKYLISGTGIINVDDWENNTEYKGYTKDDETIKCFWECVRNFSNENRTKLLLFVTGNSQVPITGFKDLGGSGNIQHFKIQKYGTKNDLPIGHTCFNRIDLPPYTSSTIMKQKLLHAIYEGAKGFTMD